VTINDTSMEGVKLLEPDIFNDERGYFFESWNENQYRQFGLPQKFVQDNISSSKKGVIRGLHYQIPRPQGKLIFVLDGEIFDVVVDLRKKSPKFGTWYGVTLSDKRHQQLFVPAGFAHGFQVLNERATIQYKCTEFYSPSDEVGIRWDDPSLAIEWPVKEIVVSEKDRTLPLLEEISSDRLFE